ncbi:MAG: hypothetical protein R2787_17520 [Saprospiraceae bacterium]
MPEGIFLLADDFPVQSDHFPVRAVEIEGTEIPLQARTRHEQWCRIGIEHVESHGLSQAPLGKDTEAGKRAGGHQVCLRLKTGILSIEQGPLSAGFFCPDRFCGQLKGRCLR